MSQAHAEVIADLINAMVAEKARRIELEALLQATEEPTVEIEEDRNEP